MSWGSWWQLMVDSAKESFLSLFTRLGVFLANLLGALIILFLGWWLAGVAQGWLVKGLKAIRLDELSQKIRVADVLEKGEIKYTLSELLGVLLYWVVILATLLAALNVLGLTAAADLLERILSYVPSVLAGVIVLVLGLFFASLLSGIVQTAAANAGVAQAKGLGQIARVAVIIFAAAIALDKFFSSVIIQTTFTIVITGVVLAAALAFGLGCKDWAGKTLNDFVSKVKSR
ncbi:MAG: hypothetical protein COV76_05480 [Candidatus Omnitrophica bacterium CG11_big_fil_rev_8_21_14_0_20_64_10]|nr:MAG: hypothetical protein COV76_05480 [Candidatus Omnitrophica bacterium CG11_big_fil_rev_8_21_14_0_20_64_10]